MPESVKSAQGDINIVAPSVPSILVYNFLTGHIAV